MKKEIIGRWRIETMEQWDSDFINLVEEGNFTFSKDGMGSFIFGAVNAEIDWGIEKGSERIDFTWEGADEGDPVCGRGWAIIESGRMEGRLYFHRGDESGFQATRTGLRTSQGRQPG